MSPRRARAVQGRVGDDPATALREHLLAAAEQLLAERQVATITTRDIARAAGVSDGVLYNYFQDKHDLLLRALVRRYSGLVAQFDARLPEPGTGTVEENLTVYARAVYRVMSAALPIAAGLLSESRLLRDFVAAIHQEPTGPQALAHPILDYLAAERELGRLGEVDERAVTTILFGSAVILAATALTGGHDPRHHADQLPAVVATLVRGLSVHG